MLGKFYRLIFLLLFALSGCGGDAASTPAISPSLTHSESAPPTTSSASAAPAAAVLEIHQVSADNLPIGDYLPPLDGGRVEVPIPSGWTPLPRESKYLARFFKNDKNGLPRIEITAEDKSYGDIDTVSDANVIQFATAVAEDLKSQGKKLLEPVLPMMLGPTSCARYVVKVELVMPQGSVIAERQTLIARHNGRTYNIQLLVLPNKLLTDRDAAYAICAGMKFSSQL